MAWYDSPFILHPLAGCGFRNFWRLYLENGPYNWRSAGSRVVAMAGCAARLPLYKVQSWRLDDAIRSHELNGPPVFIIGHWRSGTTHLHNLLSLDPRFACISFYETALPLDFLARIPLAKPFLKMILPKTRGMDNVPVSVDSPQEEEMALGALTGLSFYKTFYFPNQIEKHFRESVLFENLSDAQLANFKEQYEYIVRKISYAHHGEQRILFKNPASTTRMPLLKEIFPDAKFIHIVRNPYDVFPSMQKLWKRLQTAWSWEDNSKIDYEAVTLDIYEAVMRRFLEDRNHIPPDDLIEVRYDDLDERPEETIRAIYGRIDPERMENAVARTAAYLEGRKPYQKNRHALGEAQLAAIGERCGFAIDEWQFERPTT